MQEHVFGPSGMERSGLDSQGRIVSGRSTGYSRAASGEVVRAAYRNPQECFGCGALFSTVLDLLRFQEALVSGSLLAPRYLGQMWEATADTPWADRYGLGWFVGEYIGHEMVAARGATAGFVATLQYFPADDVVVIGLLNQDFMLHQELFQSLAAVALGEPPRQPFPSSPKDPRTHPLAAFAGEYEMEDGARVRFLVDEHGFFLDEPEEGRRFEVLPLDDHTGYAPGPNARLSFGMATEAAPAVLNALYGVLLWRGVRVETKRSPLNAGSPASAGGGPVFSEAAFHGPALPRRNPWGRLMK